MPCDGKNANCERRRELLSQLKCLISAMDQKKPCDWDEPASNPPPISHPTDPSNRDPASSCIPVKACKSYELRGSLMYRCECIKRNGLQDRCMFLDCMGRPECMTKLFPVCYPGRAALLKLTELGDARVALEKFYSADKARESALAAYCRLVSPENHNDTVYSSPLFITPPSSVTPCIGSAQSSSNRLDPQLYNSPINNQDQQFVNSSFDTQVQQQMHRPPIQRYQPQSQQQYHHQQQPQKLQEHYYQEYNQPPQQNCQQQYQQRYQRQIQQPLQQQQPMSYSYSVCQQCSPSLHPTYTQC